MKKIILTAVMALVTVAAVAQTIDYTGVTINTERVKKTYPTRMSVLLTGVGEYNSYHHAFTGELGARFVWVQRFGFYAGVELGVQGLPLHTKNQPHFDGIDYSVSGTVVYDNNQMSNDGGLREVKSKYPRATLSVGAVMRLGKHADIYLGSGVAVGKRMLTYSYDKAEIKNYLDGKWFDDAWSDDYICPTAELGGHFYIGHVTLLAGFSFVPAKRNNGYRLHLGVGYNF